MKKSEFKVTYIHQYNVIYNRLLTSMHHFKMLTICGILFLMAACDQNESQVDSKISGNPDALELSDTLPKALFLHAEWTDLLPEEDLAALMSPPDYLMEIPDGSDQDRLTGQFADTSAPPSDDPYQQALVSEKVKSELDGLHIRLPGFVVPLEKNPDQSVTSFFLVPYFGACLHVPPPPPNQIIYVDFPIGFEQTALDNAYWLYGTLSTRLIQNEVATSAYSMQVHHIEPYVEEY